jgi:hypothetical protein
MLSEASREHATVKNTKKMGAAVAHEQQRSSVVLRLGRSLRWPAVELGDGSSCSASAEALWPGEVARRLRWRSSAGLHCWRPAEAPRLEQKLGEDLQPVLCSTQKQEASSVEACAWKEAGRGVCCSLCHVPYQEAGAAQAGGRSRKPARRRRSRSEHSCGGSRPPIRRCAWW